MSSTPPLETVALLVSGPEAPPPTLTLIVRLAAVASEASAPLRVQVTVWPDAPHDQPVPEPELKLRPAGRVSTMLSGPGSEA